jgi:organic hydroperoxide reductase OsmC/OhrA
MQAYPHHYRVRAEAGSAGVVTVGSPGLAALETAAPAEFGGPGDRWSPETLLVAAVGNCFILTFRAIARASKLDWTALACDVEGVLDRVDRELRFTEFRLRAVLDVPQAGNEDRARHLMEKAEASCLVTRSLVARVHLEAAVRAVG